MVGLGVVVEPHKGFLKKTQVINTIISKRKYRFQLFTLYQFPTFLYQ